MSANAQDYDFDEYDKPGAERSRRRRGEDDDLESDLEEDLLEEDWPSGKKNVSEVSDEELNDDLLQSDDEDVNISGQDVSLNATYSLDTSYGQQDNLQEEDYTDDVVNLGAEGYEEGYQQEGEEQYTEEYSQGNDAGMPEDQVDYTEGEDGCQDEVLDIQISEPIDSEFQDDEYQTSYDHHVDEHGVHREEDPEEHVGGEGQQEEEEHAAEGSQVFDTEEFENEAVPEEETKEESDEEDEDDEESGRIRFKSERREGAVVRLADVGSKRRNIPETLELSEKAKQDLMQFEAQEQQKRQNRFGGRGRGGGGGGGGGGSGRGSRGRGGFGMSDFRGGHRGRMNDQRFPLMGNMGVQQQSSRMPPPHQPHHPQMQPQQHHLSRPRGPPPFQGHGRPLSQQPLQPLIPPHMTHRSPPLRPQLEPPPRMMSSPPPNFPQHHQQQQPPQPKNIHINPHFRGPTSSSVQVPLMPPVQSQPRPAVGPQRFPGPGDFQQHMPGNFGQPQRPPHLMEPFRNQPPQGPQDRESLFMGDRTESTRFPGQHMFDHQGPSPLMNSSNNIHQQQQLPGQGHMGFGPPGPAFSQPSQGPLGLFPREPPRPNLPPHQGHQGMAGLNQQGGPPNQPRPFMGPRQPFGQQGNLFPPPQVQFGMQNLMPGPPMSHNPLPSHQPMHQQQQHHHHHHNRQELPHHHQQQQLNFNEPRPMMHHGENPFHQQQAHGSPRHMTPHLQNPQQLSMSNRQRMNTPVSKQMQQRNSNLRELPVAPGNASMNSGRPAATPTSPSANVRPVARTTQGVRPRQNMQPIPDSGRGRGQVAANPQLQPGGTSRTVVHRENPSTAPQDPDEDEETRQYRLKLEEQKRLREEILKRKELRRQMQAGVRKKELLLRLNSHTPSQNPAPAQPQPVQQNLQMPHPLQQQPPPQQQQAEQTQQQHLQPQRQFPQRTQQPLNQPLKNPNQGALIPPSGDAQTPTLRPNVKSRLQMVRSNNQQQMTPGPGQDLQLNQPQQNQQHLQQPQQQLQGRNNALQNINRPGPPLQSNPRNIPMGPAQAQFHNEGPKPGAKRTVMQRTRTPSAEGQQVPQKVRVVKLSGSSGKMAETTGSPVQQQGTCPITPLIQGIQRKVTMTNQPQQGPGGTLHAGRGGLGNPHQNRVVVSGRGRGRGAGQMGRGRPMPTRQSQRSAESGRCTVSIEGLSSSTSEVQLQNLLRSIGPIEMLKMMPQQRKAIAKFSSPQHAASFQMSFHRAHLLQHNRITGGRSSVLVSTSNAKLNNQTRSFASFRN